MSFEQLILQKLEAEYQKLREFADREVCSSIRFEARTEAFGIKRAIDIIKRTIMEEKPKLYECACGMCKMQKPAGKRNG